MNTDTTYDMVFLALARDCAKTIPGALRSLESYDASGLQVHMVVGEDGSKDSSRELLDHHLVTVVDTSEMSTASNRLERMAIGRQIVANHSRDMKTRSFAVVDLDEPFLRSVNVNQLRSSISRFDSVFAVSAKSSPTYYDLLAYDRGPGNFIHLEDQIREARSNVFKYYELFAYEIYPAQALITNDGDINCISAFNGLAIYEPDAYRSGSYMPSEPGPWVCEHITFNRGVSASTGQEMFVDSTLVLPTPPEHGRRGLFGFIWQRVKKVPSKALARIRS